MWLPVKFSMASATLALAMNHDQVEALIDMTAWTMSLAAVESRQCVAAQNVFASGDNL
jgi:hypothetical protein